MLGVGFRWDSRRDSAALIFHGGDTDSDVRIRDDHRNDDRGVRDSRDGHDDHDDHSDRGVHGVRGAPCACSGGNCGDTGNDVRSGIHNSGTACDGSSEVCSSGDDMPQRQRTPKSRLTAER